MRVRIVGRIGLLCTALTLGALAAHALELPDLFALHGPAGRVLQQDLYRGWARVIGPLGAAALASVWALALLLRPGRPGFRPALLAACLLTAGLALFFVLDAPAGTALALRAASPGGIGDRLRGQAGQVLGAALLLIALVALRRALFCDAVAGTSRGGTVEPGAAADERAHR